MVKVGQIVSETRPIFVAGFLVFKQKKKERIAYYTTGFAFMGGRISRKESISEMAHNTVNINLKENAYKNRERTLYRTRHQATKQKTA